MDGGDPALKKVSVQRVLCVAGNRKTFKQEDLGTFRGDFYAKRKAGEVSILRELPQHAKGPAKK